MKQLYYFELKKIWNRKANQVAMLLGFILIIVCNIAQIKGETLHEGDREWNGAEAILRQMEIENNLTAELDEKFLTDFLREYQRQLAGNPAGYDYSLIEGKTNLFSCISKNYVEWNEYLNWENLGAINTDNGIGFYDRRMRKIENLLNAEYSYGNYSEVEKEYWRQKAEAVDTPFAWGCKDIWAIIWNGIGILFYLFFVVSICIAPVFAGEYQNRTDSLLLTTKHGKNKVISAKILASFTFVFFYVALCGLVGIGICIALLGSGGWDLPVQLWDTIIPYPLTALEACVINLLVIFLISFFLTAFSLLLSTFSKSPMVVLAVDVVLFFGTVFVPFSTSSGIWNKILYLFPLNCADFQDILKAYNSYQFGNMVIPYLEMIFIVYTLLTVICLLCTGKGFQKHQVRS